MITNNIKHSFRVGQRVWNVNHTTYDAEYVIVKITAKRIICKEIYEGKNYPNVSFSPENLFEL